MSDYHAYCPDKWCGVHRMCQHSPCWWDTKQAREKDAQPVEGDAVECSILGVT